MLLQKARLPLILCLLSLLFTVGSREVEASNGIVLDPGGTSTLGWAFTGVSGWKPNTAGSGLHGGDDWFAQDWNKGGGNADLGEEVLAVAPGTVIFQGTDPAATMPNYGNNVIVQLDDNPGFAVRYAHLQNVSVAHGQHVGFGDPIGTVGFSGLTGAPPFTSHLHLALYKNLDQFPDTSEGCIAGRETKKGLEWLVLGNTPCRLSGGATKFAAQFVLDPNLIAVANVPVDVYILVDLSGSFADDLPVFKAQAPAIISNLRASFPDSRFGLGKFEDYPISPFGSAPAGDQAYERLIDLTFDTNLVLNTISGLFTRFGGDAPQSQLPALFQAATGVGQDLSGAGFPGASISPGQQANFRDGATKLILLWTDAPFHNPGDPGAIPYPGPSFAETVNAILALDPPKVIGISSGPFGVPDLEAIAMATGALAPPGGVDCDSDGVIDIPEGEPLVCDIAFSGAGIGDAITAVVQAAAKPILVQVDIDIKPDSDPNSINCAVQEAVIPVAILTTEDFDAATVDHTTIDFAGGIETHVHSGTGQPQRHEEDVDGDGDIDLLFHFRLGDTDLACDYLDASITGETFDGIAVLGTDSVRMVDNNGS